MACPSSLVSQALAAIEEIQLEQGDLLSRAISKLGSYWAASKGITLDPDDFNDCGKIRYNQYARTVISSEIANTFLDLFDSGQLPEWVRQEADLKLIRAAADAREQVTD